MKHIHFLLGRRSAPGLRPGAKRCQQKIDPPQALCIFFFPRRSRHPRLQGDWSSDVCSSELRAGKLAGILRVFGDPARDLLKGIARRISEYVKDRSELARVAADRFAVVLARIDREDDVARLTEQRLAECFGTPFRVGEAELRISAKVGLSVFPNDGADADTLFKNAEAALKKAKETNERYLFYTHELTERIAGRLSLENKLRQAIERQEFVL